MFSLRQGLEDGVHLLGDGHEAELELLPRGDHPAPLVADVLERGRDVDLLAALRHPVEDHVDQDVGARAADPVAAKEMPRSVSRFVKKKKRKTERYLVSLPAVDCDGAGASSVGLVDLSPELEKCLGGGRHPVGRPGAEVELGDGPGLARAGVLQVH